MKRDPREKKLPKWAQDILDETRRQADLSWPQEPRPRPDWSFDVNGHPKDATDRPEGIAFRVGNSYSGRIAETVYFHKHYVHTSPEMSGFGSRPSGPYYRDQRDAILAALWDECDAAATKLNRCANALRSWDAEQ